ncbi:MAG: serine/threonine-protein kinase, partial [Pirellulales bacterium]
MNRDDTDEQEDLLGDLLVRYDEALANDQEDPELERSLSEVDSGLAQEFAQVRECLELMDRLRRRWNPADTAATDKGGDSTPHAHAQRVPERPADQPDPATIQPRTIGRFGIERELGRGGLGIVYLATDPKLGRKVALKIPRVESLVDDEIRRRFLREAEAAARLMHPHILPIYEVGQDGMIHYIAAEYRPGCSLSTWIKGRSEPVDPRLAAEMAMLLAEAVQHAHSRGVLHRDIKPSNVLLGDGAEQDDRLSCLDSARSLHPKLTDFGMAKLMEREGDETRSGAIVGTPAYMAPEQAEGRVHDLDARTDIYGLGAVLYELLTGHPPFQGNTDVDTLRRLVSDEPQPPRAKRSDVPHDLQAICLKCLAKRPEHRYQTAFGLANDLRRFLRGEPTRARPLNTWDRTWKWVRRRPALASACAVAAVATLLLTATAVDHHVEMERTLDELRLHAYATDMRVAADAW